MCLFWAVCRFCVRTRRDWGGFAPQGHAIIQKTDSPVLKVEGVHRVGRLVRRWIEFRVTEFWVTIRILWCLRHRSVRFYVRYRVSTAEIFALGDDGSSKAFECAVPWAIRACWCFWRFLEIFVVESWKARTIVLRHRRKFQTKTKCVDCVCSRPCLITVLESTKAFLVTMR